MILCYNFNENDNSTFRDYSTNGRDGSWNDISIVSGDDGLAAEFDGSNDAGSTDQTGIFDSADQLTLYMKLRVATTSQEREALFVQDQLELRWNEANADIDIELENSSNTRATASVSAEEEKWIKIVVRWDGSTIEIFKDSRSNKGTASLSGPLNNPDAKLGIGSFAARGNSFLGKIEDVRAYPKVLSDAAVDALFDQDTGIRMNSNDVHSFEVGDILTRTYEQVATSCVVTLVVDNFTYKALPIEGFLHENYVWVKQGHCWDSSRQGTIQLKDESGKPVIDVSDGIEKPSDIGNSSKKVHRLTPDEGDISFLPRETFYQWDNPSRNSYGAYGVEPISSSSNQSSAFISFQMPRDIRTLENVDVIYIISDGTGEVTLNDVIFTVENTSIGNPYNSNSNNSTQDVTGTKDAVEAVDIKTLCNSTPDQIHGLQVDNSANDPTMNLLGVRIKYRT